MCETHRVAGHPLAQNERCLHMFLLEPNIDKDYVPGKVRTTWISEPSTSDSHQVSADDALVHRSFPRRPNWLPASAPLRTLVIVCSQRWHGLDKTVLSCLCRQCEHNCRQDKTVLSRLDPVLISFVLTQFPICNCLVSNMLRTINISSITENLEIRNWFLRQGKTVLSCL